MKVYQCVILGSGYFSFGYAASHKDVLIVEETQLADPHFGGTLSSYAFLDAEPHAEGAKALLNAFGGEGLIKDARISVNELESALCRFLEKDMPAILLGTFCTAVEKKEAGYCLTLCNNEGLSHVFAKEVIDNRMGRGNRLGILVYLPEGKEPILASASGIVSQIEPAFFEDQRLITLTFLDNADENQAKQRSLAVIEAGLRAVGGKVLQMSYRLGGAPVFLPYRNEEGILCVNEASFGNVITAYEKGETWT